MPCLHVNCLWKNEPRALPPSTCDCVESSARSVTRKHAHSARGKKRYKMGRTSSPLKTQRRLPDSVLGFSYFWTRDSCPPNASESHGHVCFWGQLMGGDHVTHHFDITSTDRRKTTMTDLFKEPSWCEKRHNPGYIWPVWKASLPSGAWYKPSHNMSLTTNSAAL